MLTQLCVAVWTGEEGSELEEEEEVEVEEEEESGSLDEEEMKKMQSDEVCGDGPKPLCHRLLQSPLGGAQRCNLGSVPSSLHTPLYSLGHCRPGGDSL